MTSNVHILNGIGGIVNQENTRNDIDLKELEKQMIQGGIVEEKAPDPVNKLNMELKMAAEKLGISFDDVDSANNAGGSGGESTSSNAYESGHTSGAYTPAIDDYSSGNSIHNTTAFNAGNTNDGNNSTGYAYGNTMGNTMGSTMGGTANAYNTTDGCNGSTANAYNTTDGYDRGGHDTGYVSPPISFGGAYNTGDMSEMTKTIEQERRSHINSVLNMDAQNFSLEKEKQEDRKCAMLAEIDSLITVLQMEDIDLSRIPTVDENSDVGTIEATLKILRHKNDQNRCCTFAEESMMFGAYILEDIFDGKKTYFGKYKPDMVGWHNQLAVKLKRVRYDTGVMVGTMMDSYGVGSGTRFMLEIVPNMFLYSRMKKQQSNQPPMSGMMISDAEMENASMRIRNN